MDYLQYGAPEIKADKKGVTVLNLIINGLPSIPDMNVPFEKDIRKF